MTHFKIFFMIVFCSIILGTNACINIETIEGSGKVITENRDLKGFKGIIEGKYDDLPEQAFYMVGTIEEAIEKAEILKKADA